ncbi:MAG: hypothetical protein JWO07_253 [Candidatus Saccharibacteria bacterium]|nr:hypothetical protein [Candidatus Saccharibacteria bacterium]
MFKLVLRVVTQLVKLHQPQRQLLLPQVRVTSAQLLLAYLTLLQTTPLQLSLSALYLLQLLSALAVQVSLLTAVSATNKELAVLRKLRFVSSISLVYLITLGTIAGIVQSSHLFGSSVQADNLAPIARQVVPVGPSVISGKPIRIAIDGTSIDMSLIDGYYNSNTNDWTLSDTHAQFAVMSALANNQHGTTFIYGHGTDAVFGQIGEHHPSMGTVAHIYTDSGHVFSYKLDDIHDYTPNDTSILNDTIDGHPRLVVQTCTGALSQWRTMFIFEYEGVK